MKINNMVLPIAAVVLVGSIALLLLNKEQVIEPGSDNPDRVDAVPAQQDNSDATSFGGVGRLLTDEEIVQLETDTIENIRIGRDRSRIISEDDVEQAHSPN